MLNNKMQGLSFNKTATNIVSLDDAINSTTCSNAVKLSLGLAKSLGIDVQPRTRPSKDDKGNPIVSYYLTGADCEKIWAAL